MREPGPEGGSGPAGRRADGQRRLPLPPHHLALPRRRLALAAPGCGGTCTLFSSTTSREDRRSWACAHSPGPAVQLAKVTFCPFALAGPRRGLSRWAGPRPGHTSSCLYASSLSCLLVGVGDLCCFSPPFYRICTAFLPAGAHSHEFSAYSHPWVTMSL